MKSVNISAFLNATDYFVTDSDRITPMSVKNKKYMQLRFRKLRWQIKKLLQIKQSCSKLKNQTGLGRRAASF